MGAPDRPENDRLDTALDHAMDVYLASGFAPCKTTNLEVNKNDLATMIACLRVVRAMPDDRQDLNVREPITMEGIENA